MVDFPDIPGKMCDWENIEEVEGAKEALMFFFRISDVYIATGAAQSSEADIKAALERVGLDKFITGYFCKANLGVEKGHPDFFSLILAKLDKEPNQVTMIGDSLEKDIEPAIRIGINAILLSKDKRPESHNTYKTIVSLKELCTI